MNFFYRTFLLFILFYSSNTHAQDYFKGVIHYSVSYESLHPNIQKQVLERNLGTSFTAYILEDRYATIYNTKGENGWRKIIVRLDEGYTYTELEKSDTIVKTKFGNSDEKLIDVKKNTKPTKEVLGEQCLSVTLTTENTDPNAWYTLHSGTYYYSPKYKLNPKLYEDYVDGFWNEYVKRSQAVSIWNKNEFRPYFTSISEATSIEEKEVDKAFFNPNPDKVIIEELSK